MATTYTFTPTANLDTIFGNKRVKLGTLTLAGTYTTGGDAVTAAAFGLTELEELVFTDGATSIGQVPVYVKASKKVLLRETGGAINTPLAEVGAAEATAGTVGVMAVGY